MQVSLLSAIYCTTDEKAIFRGIASRLTAGLCGGVQDVLPLCALCGESFLPAERLPRMITWMHGRKEVKIALLFSTNAVGSLDCFRGGDHNLHHRTTADSRKPL